MTHKMNGPRNLCLEFRIERLHEKLMRPGYCVRVFFAIRFEILEVDQSLSDEFADFF